MEGVTLVGFLLGVFQTATGSIIAFALGLLAFRYQLDQQRKTEAQATMDTAVDALFRAAQSAAVNIETLANTKLHSVGNLAPDVETMKACVDAFYESTGDTRAAAFNTLKETSENAQSFYLTMPPLRVLEAPSIRELSLVVRQMPALTTFLHRAVSTLEDINELIEQRNSMIAAHAAENSNGMTMDRFVYFASTLAGQGGYICQSVDDDLAFFMLVKEQAENYLGDPQQDGKFIPYRLLPDLLNLLPDENRFPRLREQIVTFDYQD